MADENVVFDIHAFADEGVAWVHPSFSDPYIFLDFDKSPNCAAIANLAAIQIDEFRETNILPKLYVRSYANEFVHSAG